MLVILAQWLKHKVSSIIELTKVRELQYQKGGDNTRHSEIEHECRI